MSRNTTGAISLIELLIIVVIIGLLLSIAIPWMSGRRDRETIDLLRGELNRVVEAQQTYFGAHQRFAASTEELQVVANPAVTITIGGSGLGDGTGWNAVARSTDEELTCYAGFGSDTVVNSIVVLPGQVTCRKMDR